MPNYQNRKQEKNPSRPQGSGKNLLERAVEGGDHSGGSVVDSKTRPCAACVKGEVVEQRLNVKCARSFSQTNHRCSSPCMTAALPVNENGGRVITGNYPEIAITIVIAWKL